jgi:hypothetical protein
MPPGSAAGPTGITTMTIATTDTGLHLTLGHDDRALRGSPDSG